MERGGFRSALGCLAEKLKSQPQAAAVAELPTEAAAVVQPGLAQKLAWVKDPFCLF